ncbi:MAG: glycoside hydrolase family 3 N-terminal domain-containing protein [Saprospiraceae bacterium]
MYRIVPATLILAALLTLSANTRLMFDFSSSPDPREAFWVDSVFDAMTEDERIGQLFMLRAHTDKDSAYEQQVEDLIARYKPGGLCFFNPTHVGTVEKQAELTNRYQAASPRLPLFIAADYENGLGMRYRSSAISYPRAMMLGAVEDNRLIYEMGMEVGQQCRRMGVNVNFAPDADINNNPQNPVINERSYGEDRSNVTSKAFQYIMGLQDGGVLACAKHFPGHGDTNMDSHFDLPPIPYPRQRLDSLELYPFRALAQAGVGSIMVAHLSVPAIDDRPNRPTSLSKAAVTGLLRDDMGFEGLIFTDGMEMEGVKKFYKPADADIEALNAGNDMVLLPVDINATMQAIPAAISDGTLDRKKLYASVKRILRAKYRLGLSTAQHVPLDHLRRDLNNPNALMLKRRIIAEALTLVRDRPEIVGFPDPERYRIASLALGDSSRTIFQTYCGYYAPLTHFNAGKEIDSTLAAGLLDTLKKFDVVLVSFHDTRTKAADNFGLTESELDLVRRLNGATTVAVTMFGSPYSLRYFDDFPVLLQAYTEDPYAQQLAAQCLFGASDLKGKLPVTACPSARFGDGIQKKYTRKRLGFDLPESVGMNSDTLALMDTLVRELIAEGAAPGCQILVAKDNRVVWYKAYGYQTYEQTVPVSTETIFDLASVTKVAATTISAMKLVENGKLALDTALVRYVPELATSNKKGLTLRELMTHYAGLQAWIPFYKATLENGLPDAHIYHRQKDSDSEQPVAPEMYMANAWVDSIWQQIFNSELQADKHYKYSDLGMYLTARAVANVSHMTVDRYADQMYYRPLGLASTTFNPWQKGLTLRCAPTEEDRYFRQQRLQGYVHDMGAAMLGGVSGHAGLFSSANDLAKIFQMLLNGGSYGGKTYLRPETVKLFTTRYARSTRRGIGFDMKELNPSESQNMSELAGNNTFGHLGFTGTCVWADPDKDLIFIFLSNRTYPTMENRKLITGDYRPKIQSVVYRALKAKGK